MLPARARVLPLAVLVALSGCAANAGQLRTESPPPAAHELPPAAPAARLALTSDPDAVADVAERAVKAVVHVSAKRSVSLTENVPLPFRGFPFFDGRPQVQRGAGSGVLVDPSGLIVTNNHVVAGAEQLVVTLYDGRKFDARVKGADPATDLALLELVGKVPADLPVLPLGDSDRLRLGEVVLAIGSPFELQGTVTMGIVSARSRAPGLARYEDFVQTDAAINPGNSGGALVNLRGELVGINTAITTRSGGYDGIGFAIPANLVREIKDRLLADGRVVRGFLGVVPEDVDPSFADMLGLDSAEGVLISQVSPDEPAEKAGLKPYDVIVAVDGEKVVDARTFRNRIALLRPGTKVRLDVIRDGKRLTLTAELGSLPDDRGRPDDGRDADHAGRLLDGVRLMSLSEVRDQLRVDPSLAGGAVVVEVAPGSKAEEAGLRRGDVIVEANRQPVRDARDVRRIVGNSDRAMLLVERNGVRTVIFLG